MPYKFYIEDLYNKTEVIEPENWKDIEEVHSRDVKAHGVFFKYAEGQKLGFSCEAKDILESTYQNDGVQGYALFSVEESDSEVESYSEIFSGRLDFSTREFNQDMIYLEVQNSQTQIQFKARAKQKININNDQTISGQASGQIPHQELLCLAEKFDDAIIVDNLEEVAFQSDAVATDTAVRGNIGFNKITQTDLENFINPKTNLFADNTTNGIDPAHFLVLTRQASIQIDLEWDFTVDIDEDQGGGTTTYTWALTLLTSQRDLYNNRNSFLIANDSSNSASPYNYSSTKTGDNSGVRALYNGTWPAGTEFTLQFLCAMNGTGTQQFTVTLDFTELKVTLTNYYANVGTISRWYRTFEVVNKVLYHMTDEYDYLYSELLGGLLYQDVGITENGCFDSMRLTNGFRIRQINDLDKSPIMSFNDIFDNLNAMHGIGYGFETIPRMTGYGLLDVTFRDFYMPDALFEISGNWTSIIGVGAFVGFYNNPSIYGIYECTQRQYNSGDNTTWIWLDVSANEEYYDTNKGATPFPTIDALYEDVYMTVGLTGIDRETLRIEKWEHFYGDSELVDLGTVEEWSEEPFLPFIHNGVNIGFKKYANDEDKPTTLEDFHTEASFGSPIDTVDTPLNLDLSWIGSTWLLNESRRTLFKEKPTTSHKLDNDIFFTDKVYNSKVFRLSFDGTNDEITMPAECYENHIAPTTGTWFEVRGSTSNDQYWIYDETKVRRVLPANNIVLPILLSSVTTESAKDVTVIGGDIFKYDWYKCESDENLSNTLNLTSPSYLYNLRRTMKRFLLRWGVYLKSSISYLADTAPRVFKNLSFVNNGEYVSAIDPYADICETDTVTEKNDISSADLGTIKFKPNVINFTVSVCATDYANIKSALKNNNATASKNYGYITIASPDGTRTRTGWILKISRNPLTTISKVQLLERA